MNVQTLTAAWAPLRPVSPLIAEEWSLGDYRIVRRQGQPTGLLYVSGQTKALAGGNVGSLKHHGAVYWAEQIANAFKGQQVTPHEDGDVQVNDQGTIVLFRPVSNEAQAWVQQHVDGEALWMGPSLVVEHRFASYMIEGMVEAGLQLQRAC